MKRFVVFIFCMQFFAGVAAAQWVTSGSGIGERSGDQGLTNPDSLAQDIGYDSIEDMEEAATQGYEQNADDALAWNYASSEQFDEDCIALFGSACAEVDADEFRPLVPQIQICIGLGFESLTEMGAFVDGVEEQGGDEEDAANCKRRGYGSNSADSQLCMIATNDDENAEACRTKLGATATSSSDCSDLDRDDYEDVANNMPPRIVTPADWQPSSVGVGAGQGAVLIDILSAIDPDGDALTWSLSAAKPPVFEIDASSGVLSLSRGFSSSSGGVTRPESAQVTVQVSDGIASDNLTLTLGFDDDNGPPRIIVPADWSPAEVADTAGQGTVVIDRLTALDPDGDTLTWSLSSASPSIFAINANNGVVSLVSGFADGEQRPEGAQLTVQVSDGDLIDEMTLSLSFEDPNGPPRIVAPLDWAPSIIPNTASAGDSIISVLSATDPDNDPLTWSISAMDYNLFAINAETGVVTIAENGGATAQQPESVTLTVQVSDGELTDEMTLNIALADPNRPPRLIVPADWGPSQVSRDAANGQVVIDEMLATDPDGDAISWSLVSSDLDIFTINPQTGVMSLARDEGLDGLENRPEFARFTVQVSDGRLTDEMALAIPLEAEKINTPPQIIVPEGFADKEFAPYPNGTTSVGQLTGQDADGDALTWSLLGANPSVFSINAQTGLVSYSALGSSDKLSCVAANSDGTPTNTSGATPAKRSSGTTGFGIVSTNGNMVQDHNAIDFRSKKQGGKPTSTGKYHVTLERANHRGGTFTTEARAATSYAVNDSGGSINVPSVSAATVNSNLTPINSYLVFQHNNKEDMRNTDGVVTFENPILGIYYTDKGYDGTISRLGKQGAQYSRDYQQAKLALEDGRDIAWIDPVDRRVLHFRSRTANIGDFMRVITTASNGGGGVEEEDVDEVEPAGPDECSAEIAVQLSDGEATDEETLTLAFGDPNRAPEIIAPMDWVPELITNDKNANDRVVSVLASRDPDGDTLRWSLSGDNADLFSIDVHSGDISLAGNWSELGDRPARATVTVELTDGRLSATQEIDFNIEEKPMETSMASNIGTNGNFQFVSEDVQNIFNQDYTIMARFFHGSTGYSKPYFDYKKFKWINQSPKETIFFWGGNAVAQKFLSGLSLHVVGDTLSLQLGSDHSYLETRAPIQRNRWHTVMFAVDADQRRKTKKHNWPVKMYLNGRRLGLNEFSFETKNKGYKPIGTPEKYWPKQMDSTSYTGEVYVEANNLPVAAIGIAGTIKPGGHWGSAQRRHLPLRGSSFIHEVSIWKGDKSSVASAIYNNNRDVADYASTSVGKPRYSWKPGLLGQSKSEIHCGNMGNYWNYTTGRYTCLGTPDGEAVLEENKDWTCGWRCNPDPRSFVIDRWEGTLTLANLANGANPKNGKSDYVGPTAGNGTHRLDGDMHLYSGGLTFETEVYQKTYRKRMTGIIIPVPQAGGDNVCRAGQPAAAFPVKAWHQGGSSAGTYLSGLKKWHGWSSNCTEYNDEDIKAFATRAMSGKTKPLN